MLYAAQYSTDGNYIAAGGSGLNEAKLFDVKNHYKVCLLRSQLLLYDVCMMYDVCCMMYDV